MRHARLGAGVVFALFAASCSDSPATPSPTVGSVTISPTSSVLTAPGAQTLTATATLSNGTTQTITPVWTIDNPRVATIDGAGRLSAVDAGSASIVASHEGRSTTASVRVVPPFGGSWSGAFRQVACDAPDTAACRSLPPSVTRDLRVTARFEQRSTTVTGRLELSSNGQPSGVVDVAGAITLDGRLELEAAAFSGGAPDAQARVVGWKSTLASPGFDVMRGGFSVLSSAGGDGPMIHVTYELDGLTRIAGGAQ